MFPYFSLFLQLKAAADICLRPPGSLTLSPNTVRALLSERALSLSKASVAVWRRELARGGEKRQRSASKTWFLTLPS